MEKEKKVTLNSNTDFTASALVNHLNEQFKSKKGGNAFTFQDIQQYMRRGHLPKAYGYHPLEWVEDKKIGLKIIRVDFNNVFKE